MSIAFGTALNLSLTGLLDGREMAAGKPMETGIRTALPMHATFIAKVTPWRLGHLPLRPSAPRLSFPIPLSISLFPPALPPTLKPSASPYLNPPPPLLLLQTVMSALLGCACGVFVSLLPLPFSRAHFDASRHISAAEV